MPPASDANELIGQQYDEFRYEGAAIPLAHPDHMAVVATLHGISPPHPSGARVLELGCGVGLNLIALAEAMPGAHFLGIDLAHAQIDYGNQIIQRLGMRNVELRTQSITDLPPGEGPFDYIIAHGVFSWVPEFVRQKILEICSKQLSPTGVAYISFNVLPGRYAFSAARDLMLHHAKRFNTPQEKVRAAREILEFAVGAMHPSSPYAAGMREELELVRKVPDYYLIHEHLTEFNQSFYFTQFMELAGAAGLQFLSEAIVKSSAVGFLGPKVSSALRTWGRDVVDIEQYIDFLSNGRFRETLLCRSDVVIDRQPKPARLIQMNVAAFLQPRAGQTVQFDQGVVSFANAQNIGLATPHPPTKAAIAILRERWPASIPFGELQRAASRLAGAPESGTIDTHLAGDLLTGFMSGTVRLFMTPDPFTLQVSNHPTASPLARLLAERSTAVINRRHENILLTEAQLGVLRSLDGSRPRPVAEQIAPLAQQMLIVK